MTGILLSFDLKWWSTPDAEDAVGEEREEVGAYFCPYCHDPAPLGSWWTKEQAEYVRQLAMAEALGPQLRCMKNNLERGKRRSKGIRIEVSVPSSPRPEPLVEHDDMVRVDVPCHPEEPIKVDETWEREVACLVCGVRYPVELVRALPEADAGDTE